MKPKGRKIIAIITLCIMPFFIVSLTLALGFSDFLGGSMPAVAGVTGCLVLMGSVFLQMDKNRTERMLEQKKMEESLAEGERKLDEEIEQGTAIDVTDNDPTAPVEGEVSSEQESAQQDQEQK